ncbi:MAG: glycosyltransferase family 39 protein [Bacteroidia bacterium]|nr:glycosyltransferase family 39 protein [Bacteroidia bacterium]NNF30489.1 glycosyltransferase family 39 protein [Flavobacteriaceae bacterium]MBT8276533.1 glycosyltransferase family 39 protein [Bacteroidia bacterium]NNJ82499.1 glycosyltransferase family 39 protein [Flavobacteriaceae bacterium]NNK53863.1 glycosyltransferase family 39 protein [Flavobacteriaceae bacterium]
MKFSSRFIIYGIALFNIAIHLYAINNLEYHRDELLYFALGNHPDFGYATVPPLIGWVATVMQSLVGHSLFAVKLFPAILGGALVLVSANIARELNGGTYAQIITAISIVMLPVGLRAFHLFQPVPIDLFLWTLLLFYTIRYINSEERKYLLFLGIVAGIALLNKYLIGVLFFALIISLLFSPHRKIFRERFLYYGILIAFLIFLPNLAWQIANDFPVIGHMTALNDNQLVHVDRVDFLMDQLLMTFSVFFILLAGIIYAMRKSKYRYLALSALIVVSVLFILRGKSYYTMGVFPVLIAAGCVAVEKVIKNNFLRLVIPALIVLITLPLLPMGLPIYSEAGLVAYFKDLEEDYGMEIGRRFEDGTIHSLPQDYADQLGWEELTKITNEAYNMIPENERAKAIIYGSNYGQAGAIAVIGKKYDLPEAVSFHESFFYWIPKQFDPDIEYLVYINDEMGENVRNLFAEIEEIGSISNMNAREYGTTVYLCSKPRSSFNSFWAEIVEQVDSPF